MQQTEYSVGLCRKQEEEDQLGQEMRRLTGDIFLVNMRLSHRKWLIFDGWPKIQHFHMD